MSDWLQDLSDDERAGWDDFVEHVRRDTLQKMSDSAFVASFVPRGDEVDVKFAVELGLSIMLDKPVLAIVLPGAKVPERLRRAADEIVEADVDLEEGRRAIMEAMERMQERLP